MDNKPNATEADIEAGQAAMHGAMQSELTQREILAELRAIRGLLTALVAELDSVTQAGAVKTISLS